MWLFFGILLLIICIGVYLIDESIELIRNIIGKEEISREQIRCAIILIFTVSYLVYLF